MVPVNPEISYRLKIFGGCIHPSSGYVERKEIRFDRIKI